MSRIDIKFEMLEPLPETFRITIPESYHDILGHMNIQYYVHIYERATWGLFDHMGMTLEALQAKQAGAFALKQFIQYLSEVQAGETVTVRSRLLGFSAKRLHFFHFMVKESTLNIASTFEVLATYVDMTTRRSAAFPPDFAAQ